jgi:uncharacterized membrane protein YphA (DoxX/SURF4 family)
MVAEKVFAQVDQIVGTITNPALPAPYQNIAGGALTLFLTNILRLMFVAAGIFAFFNLVVAGFKYMNAAGDPKALNAAWAKIWQSLIGLLIIIGSFAMAVIFGQLVFGNPGFILNPKIYGP